LNTVSADVWASAIRGGGRTILVSSAHVNALGIAFALRQLGWDGAIVCLNINGGNDSARRWVDTCSVRDLQVADESQFFGELQAVVPAGDVAAVFFTDERLLPIFAGNTARRLLPSATWWLGHRGDLDTVLHRRTFYEFVVGRRLASVPMTIGSDEDPWKRLGAPFRVRVWRSWDGMRKLPRGVNVESRQGLEDWRRLCDEERLTPEDWGYQRLLSTRPEHNVSICGWHDSSFRYYVATRKRLQRSENGYVVEALRGYRNLKRITRSILEALEFSGPFEMEFVLDERSGEFNIIELNPRFWMQHRLLDLPAGHVLVRRYLGEEMSGFQDDVNPPLRFWLDTDIVLQELLSRRWYQVAPFLRRPVWAVPPGRGLQMLLQRRYPNWFEATSGESRQ